MLMLMLEMKLSLILFIVDLTQPNIVLLNTTTTTATVQYYPFTDRASLPLVGFNVTLIGVSLVPLHLTSLFMQYIYRGEFLLQFVRLPSYSSFNVSIKVMYLQGVSEESVFSFDTLEASKSFFLSAYEKD